MLLRRLCIAHREDQMPYFKDVAGFSAHTLVMMIKQGLDIAKLSLGLEGSVPFFVFTNP